MPFRGVLLDVPSCARQRSGGMMSNGPAVSAVEFGGERSHVATKRLSSGRSPVATVFKNTLPRTSSFTQTLQAGATKAHRSL